jgi:molecular chaperone GrpE (heat shock protein)
MTDIEHLTQPIRDPAGRSIEERIAAAGRRIAALQRRLDEALADLAHARRRAAVDLAQAGRYGHEDLARALLPLRDAIEAAATVPTRDAAALREGVELAQRKLVAALARRQAN